MSRHLRQTMEIHPFRRMIMAVTVQTKLLLPLIITPILEADIRVMGTIRDSTAGWKSRDTVIMEICLYPKMVGMLREEAILRPRMAMAVSVETIDEQMIVPS